MYAPSIKSIIVYATAEYQVITKSAGLAHFSCPGNTELCKFL